MQIKDVQAKDLTYIKEVATALLDAQKKLNAVVTFIDVNKQIEDYQGEQTDLLWKVPVVLKDNISTKGVKTTASSRILDNYYPVYDATIVSKLRAAGAIFVAKSSMDELGMGGTNLTAATGKVNNPWDVSRISGGSSGGSAALVAAGIVPLAIGTDTGDSVRKPAAYCGVVGLKPTYGRISRYGVIPYASSLDHVGLFTTNVQDAALSLRVLAGRDDHDMTSSYREVEAYDELIDTNIKGKRIGIIQNVCDAIKDERILQDFNCLLAKLTAQGAIIEPVLFDEKIMQALLPTYYIISNVEATANHSNLDGIRFGVREPGTNLSEIMTNSRTKGFGSNVRERFVIGSYSLFVENQDKIFRKAQKVRRVIVDQLQAKLASYDVLLAPATGGVAPLPDDSIDEKLSNAYLIAENHMLLGNFSGYPSITVPTSFVDGMPVAVNLLAKPFEETLMLSIASAIEASCDMKDVTKGGLL